MKYLAARETGRAEDIMRDAVVKAHKYFNGSSKQGKEPAARQPPALLFFVFILEPPVPRIGVDNLTRVVVVEENKSRLGLCRQFEDGGIHS